MKYIFFLLDLQSFIPPTITKIVEVFSVHKTKKKSKNNGIDGPLTSQLLILMITQ